MTPSLARLELKELGFECIETHPNGGTTWKLATKTIFIPAFRDVDDHYIQNARRHALKLSIADVPVKE